jgi:DNA polymerase-3 subunit delta
MFLIHGEDQLILKKQVDKIISKLKEGGNEFTISEYSMINDSWNKAKTDIITFDLFSNNKIIILNDAFFLTDKQVKSSSDFNVDDFRNIIDRLPESVSLILTVKSTKISSKLKIAKHVSEIAKVIPLVIPNDEQLKMQIRKKITSNGNSIDDDALDLVIELLPRDLQIIQNETVKLSLIKEPITTEVVKNVIIKTLNYDVFEISNALMEQKMNVFLKMWNNFIASNGEIYSFLSLIAKNVVDSRNVLYYKSLNWTQNDIAENLKINPYRVRILWNNKIQTWMKLNDKIKMLNRLIYNINSGFLNDKSIVEIELLKMFS